MRLVICMASVLMFFSVYAYTEEPYKKPVIELEMKPTMRSVDRDWAYFKSIPCQEVEKLVFHSKSEEMLVAKRKSQCKNQLLNQYKAFLPEPTI